MLKFIAVLLILFCIAGFFAMGVWVGMLVKIDFDEIDDYYYLEEYEEDLDNE